MKLCFCSIAFRNDPIETIVPRLAKLGYDAVEIWANHLQGYDTAQLAILRSQADEAGIGIEVVSPYLWLTQTEELLIESMDIARRTVEQARQLGCRKIRTFTDSGPTGIGSAVATPAQRATAVQALKEITAMAPDLRFVVETHPLTLADLPESTLKLLDEVGAPNLRVLYQPSPGSLFEAYDLLKPHIEHMHLQNVTETGKMVWLEEGVMDLCGFLKQVRRDGYSDSISVEYCWGGVKWERAETAREFVAKCWNQQS